MPNIQRKSTRGGVQNGVPPATQVSTADFAEKFRALQRRRPGVYGLPPEYRRRTDRRRAFFGQAHS